MYTYIPSLWSLPHPALLGCQHRAELPELHSSFPMWVFRMVVYACQCSSLGSSHPLLSPQWYGYFWVMITSSLCWQEGRSEVFYPLGPSKAIILQLKINFKKFLYGILLQCLSKYFWNFVWRLRLMKMTSNFVDSIHFLRVLLQRKSDFQ